MIFRSGRWPRPTAPCSPARWRACGCGWCCGRTPRASCSSSRWRCATCGTRARTWTCRSAPPRRGSRSDDAMRADLHVHSSASDGTDPPAEVMGRAAQAGLDVVALTDHDTVAGHAEARAAAGRLTLLPGMELSCRLNGRSLHMLAYLFDADQPELAAELARIRDDRVLRARAMVDKLAGRGVDVSWEQVAAIAGQAVVGRPHIARAMADSGAIAAPREAFTRDWIADGGRAYVGRYALDPVRAIDLVRAAGGVTVLAHPRAGRDTWVTNEQITRLAAT